MHFSFFLCDGQLQILVKSVFDVFRGVRIVPHEVEEGVSLLFRFFAAPAVLPVGSGGLAYDHYEKLGNVSVIDHHGIVHEFAGPADLGRRNVFSYFVFREFFGEYFQKLFPAGLGIVIFVVVLGDERRSGRSFSAGCLFAFFYTEFVFQFVYSFLESVCMFFQAVFERTEEVLCVQAEDIAERDFMQISDGQKQRVLFARALCQQPRVLVLDEPTSFLDIHNKIELLDILIEAARERQTTVILSLHEIDLAEKVSDLVMCVRGDRAEAPDRPQAVFTDAHIRDLYGLTRGSYLVSRGSVELVRPEGKPRVFVIGGAGRGLNHYRELQRRRIPFAAGILFKNDMEYEVARALAQTTVSAEAFEPVPEEVVERAAEAMLSCRDVLLAWNPDGQTGNINRKLVETAQKFNKNIVFSVGELQ